MKLDVCFLFFWKVTKIFTTQTRNWCFLELQDAYISTFGHIYLGLHISIETPQVDQALFDLERCLRPIYIDVMLGDMPFFIFIFYSIIIHLSQVPLSRRCQWVWYFPRTSFSITYCFTSQTPDWQFLELSDAFISNFGAYMFVTVILIHRW